MPIIPFLLALLPWVYQQESTPKPFQRHGIPKDPTTFKQNTPDQLRQSLLKALNTKRIDYILAHLADPAFVDTSVQNHFEGKFDGMVKESTAKLVDSPLGVQLKTILQEGDLIIQNNLATITHTHHKNKSIHLRKAGDFWYLENRTSNE